MTAKRIVLIALLILVTAIIVGLVTDERDRTAILKPADFITTGSRFGISIGEPAASATTTLLRAKWRYLGVRSGGYCMTHRYPADTKVLTYFDESWRAITLCLGVKDGRVLSIQWNAAVLSPEL